jgi:lipid-binding SYLF domain-containing protein
MNKLISLGTVALAAFAITNVQAASLAEQRMLSATEVIQEFTNIPEQAIPHKIMNNAYGIAVLPSVIKIGFGIAGSFGKGVLTVRQEDGTWSNPTYIKMGGGSIGWQIGAQSTDLVMVFKDRRSIDNIVNGKLTLGGNASAAAGPVGRQTSASTDERLTAEIYSYSRNRGLFAGISLDGSWLGMDHRANSEFYGNGMTPRQILDGGSMPTPLAAQTFMEILAATAPGSNAFQRSRTAQASIEDMPALEPVGATAFPIEPVTDNDETFYGDETTF